MQAVQIYDPALCCSTGVCGVEVDQALVTFAGDVEWAIRNGGQVQRFNLAHQPQTFAEQPAVRNLLERSGQESLPVSLVSGEVVLTGRYPTRTELAKWTGLNESPLSDASGSECCSGRGCC